MFLTIAHLSKLSYPLLATVEVETGPIILSGVLLSLIVIYLASKIGSYVASRFGLTPVLGELVAGVIVGVSALRLIVFPEGGFDASNSLIMSVLIPLNQLTPESVKKIFASQTEVITVLAQLGAIIHLFEMGLESNLRTMREVGIQAFVVACVGVAVPFAAGTVGLIYVFHVPTIAAIFAGAALTATSIGITSKILAELDQLKSREGQIIVGAAVIDDVLGIIVLAVVVNLAKTGEVNIVNIFSLVISAVILLVGSVIFGGIFNKTFVSIVNRLDKPETRGNIVIPAFIFAYFMAFLGIAVRLEAILGSFAAGLVLDEIEEHDVKQRLDDLIKPVADLLVPIFFVTVGARADLNVLNPFIPENRNGFVIAIFLVIVAIAGKMVTGLVVFGEQNKINRLAIGIGMIPRGEVGLVFVSIGTASGVINKPLQVAIVVMVIVTTFLAPPLLRFAFDRAKIEQLE
jgi:Kef-type K+ transport system membrane component KefB